MRETREVGELRRRMELFRDGREHPDVRGRTVVVVDVCHTVPRSFGGVGRWYRDFAQVSDDEVLALVAEVATPVGAPGQEGTRPGRGVAGRAP